jgi:uncharacterized protein YlxW (UPF0749 family)
MSDETKEVNMTETENENNVAELRETNANLLAERDNLMGERKELQNKIASLEERLDSEKRDRSRIYQWYMKEQDKVRALVLIIKAMKSDSVTIDQIVERITKAV